MRAVWIAVGLVVFAVVLSRKFGPSRAPSADSLPAPMAAMRRQLLEGDAATFRVRARPSGLWGVVVEEGDDSGTAMVVALADGNASVYASSGEASIGGIGRESARRITASLMDQASSLMERASATTRFPLPRPGYVRFHFLTSGGVRVLEASMRALASEFSSDPTQVELTRLFGTSLSLVEALQEPRGASAVR